MPTFGDLPFELRVNIFIFAARLTFAKTWLPQVHRLISRSQARWKLIQSGGRQNYRQIVVSDSASCSAVLRVSVSACSRGVFHWYELISEGPIWREVRTTKCRRKKKVWVLHRELKRTGKNSFYMDGVWQHLDMSYKVRF